MIVLDTSALVAVLTGEPERDEFNRKIAAASRTSISAANYVEAHIVVKAKLGEAGTGELSLYLHEAGTEVMAVDRDQADLARLAYAKYGRGAHRAALNFGDCFAYALATRLGAPLLYQGTGFSLTDVTGA